MTICKNFDLRISIILLPAYLGFASLGLVPNLNRITLRPRGSILRLFAGYAPHCLHSRACRRKIVFRVAIDRGLRVFPTVHATLLDVVVRVCRPTGHAGGGGVPAGVRGLLRGLLHLRIPPEVWYHQQVRLPHARQH